MWQNLLKEDVSPEMLSNGNVIRTIVGDRLYSEISEISTLSNFLTRNFFTKLEYKAWLDSSTESKEFKDFLKSKLGKVKEIETRLLNFKDEFKPKIIRGIMDSFDSFYGVTKDKRGKRIKGSSGLMGEEVNKPVPENLMDMAQDLADDITDLGSEGLSNEDEQDLFIKILNENALVKLELIKLLINTDGELTKNSKVFDYVIESSGKRFVEKKDLITPESRGYKDYYRNLKKILFILRDSEDAVIRLSQFASRAYGLRSKIPINIETISGRGKRKLLERRKQLKNIKGPIVNFHRGLSKIKEIAETNPGSYPITNKRLRKEYEKVKDKMRNAISEIILEIEYKDKEKVLSTKDRNRIKEILERENVRSDTFSTSELREKNRRIESVVRNDALNFELNTNRKYLKVLEEYEGVLAKIVEERERELQKNITLIESLSKDLQELERKINLQADSETTEIIEEYTTGMIDSMKSQLLIVKDEISELVETLTDEKFKEEDKMEELLEELLEGEIEDPDFDKEDTKLLLQQSQELESAIKRLEKIMDFIREEISRRPEE